MRLIDRVLSTWLLESKGLTTYKLKFKGRTLGEEHGCMTLACEQFDGTVGTTSVRLWL